MRFKGIDGVAERISFIWWPGLISKGILDLTAAAPKFIGGKRYFRKEVGYFLHKGPEFSKFLGEKPRTAIGAVIVVWPTDVTGMLDKARMANGEIDVMSWIINEGKYRQITALHSEFPLGQHDVITTCTDSKFQRMGFAPCKDSVLRALQDNPRAKPILDGIIHETIDVIGKMETEIARDLTLDQVKSLLAGQAPAPGFGPSPGAAIAPHAKRYNPPAPSPPPQNFGVPPEPEAKEPDESGWDGFPLGNPYED